jgi:hypothetical protein
VKHAELRAGVRYDMPPGFGPSVAPEIETDFDVHNSTVEFETSAEAVSELMPRWFVPPSRPRIAVTYRRMIGMAWMGGRDYQIVSVRVTSTYTGDPEQVVRPFALVIWESDYAPVVAGRELMGAPKLVADIPPVEIGGHDHGFECREYDTVLVSGRVHDLTPVGEEQVARRRSAAAAGGSYFWKFIPGPGNVPDADYPVRISMTTPFVRMWEGQGELEWGTPSVAQAPYSAKVVERLSSLPRRSDISTTVWHAEACILSRKDTVRLDIQSP